MVAFALDDGLNLRRAQDAQACLQYQNEPAVAAANKRELAIPDHHVTLTDTTPADSDQHFSRPWRGDSALLDFKIAFGFS
jgi:hypothetical protein